MNPSRSAEDIRRLGLKALAEALGPADAVRFLQSFNLGWGDYTKERDQVLDLELDEIVWASRKEESGMLLKTKGETRIIVPTASGLHYIRIVTPALQRKTKSSQTKRNYGTSVFVQQAAGPFARLAKPSESSHVKQIGPGQALHA